MQFAYMVATPEVRGPRVTAWRGDLERAFDAVARSGFAGVELMVRDPLEQDASRLKRLAGNHGLSIPVLCTGEVYGEDGLSLADPDPAIRTRATDCLKAMVQLASQLGAHVNVGRLRGRFNEAVLPGQTLNWIREGLRSAAGVNPAVRVLLEPINRNVSNCILTTVDGLTFVEALAVPNVNLMLDTMHMEAEGENIWDSFSIAARQCYHVHVGQADRLAPGTGTYDFEPIFRALRTVGYRSWVGVEVWQEPDQETALQRSAKTLKPFMAEGGASN